MANSSIFGWMNQNQEDARTRARRGQTLGQQFGGEPYDSGVLGPVGAAGPAGVAGGGAAGGGAGQFKAVGGGIAAADGPVAPQQPQHGLVGRGGPQMQNPVGAMHNFAMNQGMNMAFGADRVINVPTFDQRTGRQTGVTQQLVSGGKGFDQARLINSAYGDQMAKNQAASLQIRKNDLARDIVGMLTGGFQGGGGRGRYGHLQDNRITTRPVGRGAINQAVNRTRGGGATQGESALQHQTRTARARNATDLQRDALGKRDAQFQAVMNAQARARQQQFTNEVGGYGIETRNRVANQGLALQKLMSILGGMS